MSDRELPIPRCCSFKERRADRIYERTQLDVEMSFAEPDDIMAVVEECYTAVFERFAAKPLHQKPWPRMTYDDAMRRFGSDRPDTRFAMELGDLTEIFRGTGLAVFRDAIAQGRAVRARVVPGAAY